MSIYPAKAQSPLIIDANAVLASSIPTQGFEPITGRGPHEVQGHGAIQLSQLACRHCLKRTKLPWVATFEQSLRLLAFEAQDHEDILLR